MKFIEDDYCELKSILTKDIKKEIIAFANTKGGKIFIGISDNGEVVGIDNIDSNLQSLTGMINEGIKPSLIEHTQIKVEQYDNKDIIIIEIQSSPNKPYYLADKGLKPSGVYLRHGSSSIQASDELIRKMIFEHSGLRFEEMTSKSQNLTFKYLESKFNENNLIFNKSKYKILNIIDDNNNYTNLGLLLSDECPYSIKCAIYNGTNKLEFKDRKEFTGSVLKQVNEVFEYLDLFNKTKGRIVGLERIDTKDYPEYAIRESLLNAIIHRDYNYKGSILISLYDDHFEITSLGGIVKGLSLNDLYLGISESRNPNLANIFYRLKYVESFGTGIGRIIQSYDGYNKKPIFVDTDNAFNVTLYNVNYVENHEKILPSNLTQEEKIVEYLKKNNKINRNIVEQLLDISSTRAKNILNNMCEKELIIMIGNGRNTMYVLK